LIVVRFGFVRTSQVIGCKDQFFSQATCDSVMI